MKPAIKAEDWRGLLALPHELFPQSFPEKCHALAARNLYKQDFGFTRWMADWLWCRDWDRVPVEIQHQMRFESDVDEYIAERIEALLPPEKT